MCMCVAGRGGASACAGGWEATSATSSSGKRALLSPLCTSMYSEVHTAYEYACKLEPLL